MHPGSQDAGKISTGYAQPVEKQTLLNSRILMKSAAHIERNFGFAMMGFECFLKHFRSTTREKVARDILHCNSFFFTLTQVLKPLWALGFMAAPGK